MKKILFFTFIALVAILSSCVKLDEKNFSTMNSEEYYSRFSADDIPAAVGVLYADLRLLYAGTDTHTAGSWMYTNEEVADIWITPKRGGSWYDGGIYYYLNKHTWEWDHPHPLNNWRKAYRCINDCNRLLFEFQGAGVKNDALFAEIRVARAFWYYVLCDMFGNVPIQTKYDVPTDYLPETSSRQEVFDFVVKEIKECRDLLPKKSYGRWDYYSATGILATMFLNAESWGITTEKNPWDETITYCDEIIGSGNYIVEKDYSAPFVTNNENSGEIVMGVVNDEVYNTWDALPWTLHLCTMHWKYCYHANTVTQYWGGICATPEFAYSYDPDDLRYAKSWFEGQLYDNTGEYTGKVGSMLYCDPWDSRSQGQPLCHTKDIPLFEGDQIETTSEAAGVRTIKYEIKTHCLNRLSNDFVLFRLPYFIFAKAEALYHKSGATQDVCDLINSVRERAFQPFDESKKLKPEQLDDERFLKEYGWEFCMEGYRRQQMIRFGKFTTATWFLHDKPSEDFRKLFPIPRQEILANPKLKQNAGYPSK